MTIRHMKIFRALYEQECNTTKAAEKMNMTQPAVSLAIKELEQYYNVRLFERMGRRLKITEAGKLFYEYAVRICLLFDEMEEGLAGWNDKGIIRIGASITIGSHFLPEYLMQFKKIKPHTEVRVTVEQTERLVRKLMENQLDICLVEGVAEDENIVSERYMDDSLCVICPADEKWKNGDVMTKDEFLSHNLLMRERGSGTREVFEKAASAAQIKIEPMWEAMSTTAIINGVANRLGISVLPEKMVADRIEKGDIVKVKTEWLDLARSLYIIRHKDKFLTPSIRAFMEICRENA